MPSESQSRPVIVLCHARTGSTLLAYLLNSNPSLYCPSETNFGQVLQGMARWVAEIARNPEALPGAELIGELELDVMRGFVDALYETRLREERATRWCDKSLGTYAASELLERLFPGAQYICLYRNFPDFAASALEACPFGLRSYGFEPYAHETPGNAIFSLARYWADHTEEILTFQGAHPETAIGLTYESLVQQFDASIALLGRFLNAPWDEESLGSASIFRQKYWTGPQDHKIQSTNRIHSESVHRNWILPVDLIHPETVQRVNELQARLGYVPIDELPLTDVSSPISRGIHLAELDQLMAEIRELLNRNKQSFVATRREVVIRLDVIDLGVSLQLVPVHGTVVRLAETVCDAPAQGTVRSFAESVCDLRVSSSSETLRRVISGRANVSSLMLSGQLKVAVTVPEPPDMDVMTTMHHFWKAMYAPEFALPPVVSPQVFI